MKLKEVLKQELQLIKIPESEEKELKKSAQKLISKIQKVGKVKATIGGSLAKGTLVRKDKQDVDIFVEFKDEKSTENLQKILRKAKLKFNIVHGSRDYCQIVGEKNIFEIVPVIKNTNPQLIKNVTDFSLSHVNYIKKQISKNKKLSEEIKLAKAFCHANKCYGAESYIHGFSGYSLEVLVCHFKSFEKFLKEVGRKKFYDPQKHFRNEKIAMLEINASKLTSPIVVVDPTYKYRNVTAGLGKETFEKFLETAKAFLKKPSLEFFTKQEISKEELQKFAKQNKAELLELRLQTERQEGDIAGTKMKKFLDFLEKELERKQQKVLKKEFDYSGKGTSAKGYLIFKFKEIIEIQGPKIDLPDAVKKFKKFRKKTFKKGNQWFAKEKVSIKEIINSAKKVGEEMGVEFKN